MSNATEFISNNAPTSHINGVSTAVESQDESEQWERPLAQRDMIIDHFHSGRTLTQQEAKDLYGCTALAAVIHGLRRDCLNIVTERIRNERGRSIARYRLVEEADESQSADEPDQIPAEEPTPFQEPPQPSREPVTHDDAKRVQSLAVVMDQDSPRLQIDGVSYRLSKTQMRYLAVTMDLFADIVETE